jgi:integrative and conjugative element protein (TIGR02256 family)
MRKLVFSDGIFERINEIVHAVAVETGVRIFGDIGTDRYVVRHIVGPGRDALQEPCDYSCDNDYAEREYTRLLKADSTLQWLGELHVHPSGYPHLSRTDRRTAREVICGTEDVLHPAEFIVGVIQRTEGPDFEVFPVLFSKTNLKGETLEVDYGKRHLREKSGRTERIIAKARRYCRMWQCRRRGRRHRRPDGPGNADAHRP